MSDIVFFSLPCRPCINLHLKRSSLTFWDEYCGRSVLTAKMVAQIGFDLCESACAVQGDIEAKFRALTNLSLDEQTINASKYAPVETKVFGTLDESAAVYSLGVMLRELLISTGRSDMRLKAIFDKACGQYAFTRYADFREIRDALGVYLKTEVDEQLYGVFITADIALPEPTIRRTHKQTLIPDESETACFTPYTRVQKVLNFISKNFTPTCIQIALAVFFIVFSSISIPLTSSAKSHDVPTLSYYQSDK